MPRAKSNHFLSILLHAVLLAITAWHLYITTCAFFSNHIYAHDQGIIDYFLYNTWHGHFFHDILVNDCFFERHFAPTLILLIPFQILFQHPLTLLIMETAVLMSGGWALAWLTSGILRRGKWKTVAPFPPLGLALGILYACNLLTGSIALAYHYESLSVGLMLWALAAFANRRRCLFWTTLILTLGLKSDICTNWLVFSGWWIIWGWENAGLRAWKFRLPRALRLFAVSLAWLVLVVAALALFRHMHGTVGVPFSDRYSDMGDTLGQKAVTILTHQKVFWAQLGRIAGIILPTVLFLPLLSPSSLLLLLPGTCFMGLTNHILMRELLYYYSYSLVPFLILGTALSIVKIARWSHRLRRHVRAGLVVFLLLFAAYQIARPTRTDEKYRLPDKVTRRHAWIRSTIWQVVPLTASVAAQNDLLCQIPYRMNIFMLNEDNIHKAEYWVIDKKGFYLDIGGTSLNKILREGETLARRGEARILVNQDDFIILRRVSKPGK